jgi:integrase
VRGRTGYVRKQKDGTWLARVSYRDPITNGRRWKKRTARTRTEAFSLRDKLVRDLEAGHDPDAPRVETVADLCRYYVATCCTPPVFENNRKIRGMADWRNVKRIVENVILPNLGSRKLRTVTFGTLQAFRNSRLDTPKTNGAKRSLARVNREMACIRAMLNVAVRDRFLSSNPINAGKAGNSLIVPGGETPRDRVLTPHEEARMVARCQQPDLARFYLTVILALDTGLRRGELLAVELGDVDLDARRLNIRATTTKSKRPRAIGLTDRLRDAIAARIDGAASPSPATRLVDLSPVQVRRDFATLMASTNIKDFQFRDLRHCYSTRLMDGGLTETSIQILTGHSTPKLLRRHYLNRTEGAIDNAAEILNRANALLPAHPAEDQPIN